jgi:hypothetical protein
MVYHIPIVLVLGIFHLVRYLRRLPGKHLPGPHGLPILGNILQIPGSHEWITYTAWSKIYGAPVLSDGVNKGIW